MASSAIIVLIMTVTMMMDMISWGVCIVRRGVRVSSFVVVVVLMAMIMGWGYRRLDDVISGVAIIELRMSRRRRIRGGIGLGGGGRKLVVVVMIVVAVIIAMVVVVQRKDDGRWRSRRRRRCRRPSHDHERVGNDAIVAIAVAVSSFSSSSSCSSFSPAMMMMALVAAVVDDVRCQRSLMMIIIIIIVFVVAVLPPTPHFHLHLRLAPTPPHLVLPPRRRLDHPSFHLHGGGRGRRRGRGGGRRVLPRDDPRRATGWRGRGRGGVYGEGRRRRRRRRQYDLARRPTEDGFVIPFGLLGRDTPHRAGDDARSGRFGQSRLHILLLFFFGTMIGGYLIHLRGNDVLMEPMDIP